MTPYKLAEENLTQLVRTKADADAFFWQLDELVNSIYSQKMDLDSYLKTIMSYEKKEQFEQLMSANAINKTNSTDMQNFITSLKETISALPLIELSLPIQPTENMLDMMAEWFRKNYQRSVLFKIEVDPTLIAGAIIGSGGLARDYTLKKYIQDKKE